MILVMVMADPGYGYRKSGSHVRRILINDMEDSGRNYGGSGHLSRLWMPLVCFPLEIPGISGYLSIKKHHMFIYSFKGGSEEKQTDILTCFLEVGGSLSVQWKLIQTQE